MGRGFWYGPKSILIAQADASRARNQIVEICTYDPNSVAWIEIMPHPLAFAQ